MPDYMDRAQALEAERSERIDAAARSEPAGPSAQSCRRCGEDIPPPRRADTARPR